MEISSKVADMMTQKGMTVQGLADKAGISQNTVMRARGDMFIKCSVETLAKIAHALGCKVRDLFSE